MKEKKKMNIEKLKNKTIRWQNVNKKAIDAYNKRIKENGLFGDEFRRF